VIQEKVAITYNQEVMTGINLLKVRHTGLAAESKAGQFVMITCDSGSERILRRPISIFNVEGDTISFLFAKVGSGTEWLAQRQIGEKIDLLGPMGNTFEIKPGSKNILMLAGGIGIAPLNFLANQARKKGLNVRFLAGARSSGYLCPESLLPQGVDFIPATEDGSAGSKGFVTALLPEYTGWADQIFICGPLPMYKALAASYSNILKEKDVQISLEVRMGCGLGFCYACTIKTAQGLKQVCKDGPVFHMQDIIWEEMK
jgi:dihydroorotate dehydrogenase electron transfer subunit